MKICKVCFKNIENEIYINDILNIFEHDLCYSCFKNMELVLRNIKINNLKVFVLIKYNNFVKELIYKYKGLYDIELKKVFTEFFKDIIIDKYRGYSLAYAPSTHEDDLKRGFNHVKEIFSFWEYGVLDCFYKIKKVKQSSRKYHERREIMNEIGLNVDQLKGIKKLLIVDDIVTTGSTIKACYSLVKKQKNIKIKLLTICIV